MILLSVSSASDKNALVEIPNYPAIFVFKLISIIFRRRYQIIVFRIEHALIINQFYG